MDSVATADRFVTVLYTLVMGLGLPALVAWTIRRAWQESRTTWARLHGGPIWFKDTNLTLSRALVAVLIFAMAIRIAFVVGHPLVSMKGDATQYEQIGVNIAAGTGFSFTGLNPTLERPPLFPTLIAALYAVGGPNRLYVQLANVALGVATVALAWMVGVRLGGPIAGLISGLLTALDYHQVIYTWMILTETLFTFALTLAAVALLDAQRSRRGRDWAVVGVLTGLLALIRPAATFLVFAWAIVPLISLGSTWRQRWRFALRLGLLTLIGAVAAVLPWTARNYTVTGTLVPIAVGTGGINLWAGSYPPWGGYWVFDAALRQPHLDAVLVNVPTPSLDIPEPIRTDLVRQRNGSSVESDRAFTEAAIKNIREDPLRYLRYCLLNVGRTWLVPVGIEGPSERIAHPGLRALVYYGLGGAQLLAFGAATFAGVVLTRRKAAARVLLLTIVYFAAVAAVVPGIVRFRAPLEPILFGFCGVAIALALSRIRGGNLGAREAVEGASST